MTYQQLGDYIRKMTPEQRNAAVTVHFGKDDEFYAEHPFLVVLGE